MRWLVTPAQLLQYRFPALSTSFLPQVFEKKRGKDNLQFCWQKSILDALIKLELNWDLTEVSMHAKGKIIDC